MFAEPKGKGDFVQVSFHSSRQCAFMCSVFFLHFPTPGIVGRALSNWGPGRGAFCASLGAKCVRDGIYVIKDQELDNKSEYKDNM